MTRDRTCYRLESNERLIEEAKENPSAELAIVLAERLETGEWDIKYARWQRKDDDSY
jgi:hypothetical protein